MKTLSVTAATPGARSVRRGGEALRAAAACGATLLVLVAAPVLAAPETGAEPEAAGNMRAALATSVPKIVNTQPPMPKAAAGGGPGVGPAAVSAAACAGCRDGSATAKPLLPALPGGESYELRILKGAVSGFALRLSDSNSAANPDEHLRIRISRQRIGVFWQRSF